MSNSAFLLQTMKNSVLASNLQVAVMREDTCVILQSNSMATRIPVLVPQADLEDRCVIMCTRPRQH